MMLIVDDPSFRRVLEYHPKEAGYRVTAAEDTKAALEFFSRTDCHAMLTDLEMPDLEFASSMRFSASEYGGCTSDDWPWV